MSRGSLSLPAGLLRDAEDVALWLLKYLPNMPASHIAIYNDMRGPSNSITLREASPGLSLEASQIIRWLADIMLCGPRDAVAPDEDAACGAAGRGCRVATIRPR